MSLFSIWLLNFFRVFDFFIRFCVCNLILRFGIEMRKINSVYFVRNYLWNGGDLGLFFGWFLDGMNIKLKVNYDII